MRAICFSAALPAHPVVGVLVQQFLKDRIGLFLFWYSLHRQFQHFFPGTTLCDGPRAQEIGERLFSSAVIKLGFGATRAKCYDRLGVREGGFFSLEGWGAEEREGAESIGGCDEVGKLDDPQTSKNPCPFFGYPDIFGHN